MTGKWIVTSSFQSSSQWQEKRGVMACLKEVTKGNPLKDLLEEENCSNFIENNSNFIENNSNFIENNNSLLDCFTIVHNDRKVDYFIIFPLLATLVKETMKDKRRMTKKISHGWEIFSMIIRITNNGLLHYHSQWRVWIITIFWWFYEWWVDHLP